jgi:hypothetical protein
MHYDNVTFPRTASRKLLKLHSSVAFGCVEEESEYAKDETATL